MAARVLSTASTIVDPDVRESVTSFLRSSAALDLDDQARWRLAAAATRVRDWTSLAERAEAHGLAPLVGRHVRRFGLALPQPTGAQLAALTIRHREAAVVFAQALQDIVRAFHAAGVTFALLKGAVLAHDLYPSPDLRPLRDIDVLVARGSGGRARRALELLEFRPSGGQAPWVRHHFPPVARWRNGYKVTVEVHEEAMNFDQPERLSLSTLSEPLRSVRASELDVPAFGHVDMLRHLTAHLLEPGDETRLLGVVDLVAYASLHASAIDWDHLRSRHRRVTNAISLMHYVHPLPASLQFLVPEVIKPAPAGIGRNIRPLHAVSLRRRPGRVTMADIAYPPEWWMRAYYGVPAGRALAWTRWTRHAGRVAYWIARRTASRNAAEAVWPRFDTQVRSRRPGRIRDGASGRHS